MPEASGCDEAAYTVSVRGLLGPVALSRVPWVAASWIDEPVVLVASADSADELLEVVGALVRSGVQVDSVRMRGVT